VNDHPQLEDARIVNARGSVLRRVQRRFKASTFVVAEKKGTFCVLSRVDWGFTQDDLFTPNVHVAQGEVIPVGVGKTEKSVTPEEPLVHGPDAAGMPLTSSECKEQPPFGECPEEASGPGPAGQASASTEGPEVGESAGSAARVERRAVLPGPEEASMHWPSAIVRRKAVEADASGGSDHDARVEESEAGASRAALKRQIELYENACSGTASVKCQGGEIVEDLPPCFEEAPCGIAECTNRHERKHARELEQHFLLTFHQHPCKHPDGRPFPDGFNEFGGDFITETAEALKAEGHKARRAERKATREWKRFLAGSELRAYGTEVECLREMRRNSQERLCRGLLARVSAKAGWRRFLAAFGINPQASA
jgi:hypothetical protein